MRLRGLLVLLLVGVLVAGCTQPQEAGPQEEPDGQAPEVPSPPGPQDGPAATAVEDLVLPPGVEGEAIASGLSFPTSIDWDENGTAYVALAGFVYGAQEAFPAQVLRMEDNGSTTVVAEGFDPPVTDLTWHEGKLYVSERGRVTMLDPANDWEKVPILTDLPSEGDHHNNEIVFGPDGRLYVLQGTATNSAIVGFDNHVPALGWEANVTEFSDIPCENVTVSGVNYETSNFFVGEPQLDPFAAAVRDAKVVYYNSSEEIPADAAGVNGSRVVTGPFQPFGTPTHRGQVIPGELKCNAGALFSANPDGSDLRVEAWGFRNPFAMKFAPDGSLYVTVNGYDNRGSRPVGATPDEIWRVDVSGDDARWYGWPDYSTGIPLSHPFYSSLYGPPPEKVLLEDPNEVPEPFSFSGAHASANKFDLGPQGTPFEGDLFVAEYGTINVKFVRGGFAGMAVTHVDTDTGRVTEFITHQDRYSGKFRPVEAVFGPDGRLYVVDVGPYRVATQAGGQQTGAQANATGADVEYQAATGAQEFENRFQAETGSVFAFRLPDTLDWEGYPAGNVGGDGTTPQNVTVVEEVPEGVPTFTAFDYGFGVLNGTARVGEPIAMINLGDVGHTVTHVNGTFNTGWEFIPDAIVLWTPSEPGEYSVYCEAHPVMRGTIQVEAA